MHICFLQYNLQGGGAERKVCTLANYFVSQGHKVEIGLFGVNQVAYKLDSRVEVVFLRRKNFEYHGIIEKYLFNIRKALQSLLLLCISLLEFILKQINPKMASKASRERLKNHFDKRNEYIEPIRRFIQDRKDSVFITMMVSSYLEILNVMSPFWSERITVPYLVMDCNDPKRNADATMNGQRSTKYPKAARVLVMTQAAKEYFNEEIQKKCVVIPNPIRDDLPSPYYGERKNIIVNYCRLNRQKNLPLLIKSFVQFHKVFPHFKLEIYGQGELKEQLEDLIQEMGLTDFAHILPFDANIHQKIRDYAMLVSSSDWEGFPNTVLEALCLGMPVISTDCDFGPRDMIKDYENGLLVPVDDEIALTNAMVELASNRELANKLGKNAIKIRDLYSVDVIGKRWLDLIIEVKNEFNSTQKKQK